MRDLERIGTDSGGIGISFGATNKIALETGDINLATRNHHSLRAVAGKIIPQRAWLVRPTPSVRA